MSAAWAPARLLHHLLCQEFWMIRAPWRSACSRKRGLPARILIWLVRLVLAFVLISVLWVLAYRFVPPPITATMLGDVFAGRGLEKEWMRIEEIESEMVSEEIAAEEVEEPAADENDTAVDQ